MKNNRPSAKFIIRLVFIFAGLWLWACLSVPIDTASNFAKLFPPVENILQAQFTRVKGNAQKNSVLDVGGPESWYSDIVSLPTVDFDGKAFRMWFTGAAKTDDPSIPYGSYEQIGLAISLDGINWTVANDGKPVFTPQEMDGFDRKGVTHPNVLRVGEKFLMWYGGIDGTLAKDLGLERGNVRVERIGLAISEDGIQWKRANGGNPVLDIGPPGSIDSVQATGMHVLMIKKEFVMWYGAYGGQHKLGIATSFDGIHWTKENGGRPVSGLLGEEQLGPSVYFDGHRYLLFYSTVVNQQWVMFAASSPDGVNWLPLNYPVLDQAPEDNFDSAGPGRNHSVHPSQLIFFNPKALFFFGPKALLLYGGEDSEPPNYQRIGLMEAVLTH